MTAADARTPAESRSGEADTPATWRAAIAEALGTFALVFAGTGAVVVEAQTGALGHVGVTLTFGLVLGTSDLSSLWVYLVGPTAGALFAVMTYRAVYGDRAPHPLARTSRSHAFHSRPATARGA